MVVHVILFSQVRQRLRFLQCTRKIVLPGLKYYRMLIRNITDWIGASLALFLGLILNTLFPHLLRSLTGERL
jgi:hypothetical protein